MNKTIYVSDDDLPMFDEAQRLFGGNLSAVIAHALRQFVDSKASVDQTVEAITVVVGKAQQRRRERFLGRHVADWRHPESQGKTAMAFSVYRTKRGRWALYRRQVPLTPAERALYGTTAWDTAVAPHDDAPRLDVFDIADDMKAVIPPELASLVEADPLDLPLSELDI